MDVKIPPLIKAYANERKRAVSLLSPSLIAFICLGAVPFDMLRRTFKEGSIFFLPMIKPGIERISKLLEHLNNPQHQFKSVHVAGTNGKGSCCSFLNEICLAHNIKSGMFCSPHYLEERDSIVINGAIISPELYKLCGEKVGLVDLEYNINCSSFEKLTACAFLAFAEFGIDLAIVEVGMGGLLDATNVINALISIIMPISFDHQDFLGKTIESIAVHKAGIIKPNTLAILAPQRFPSACKVVKEQCEKQNAPLYVIDSDANLNFLTYEISSDCVSYLRENLKVALKGAELLDMLGWKLDYVKVQGAIQRVKIWGRLEWFKIPSGNVLIDSAHNPDGIFELGKYLKNKHPITFLFGCKKGRDLSFLGDLITEEDTVIPVTFPQPEGMPWIDCEEVSIIEEQLRLFTKNILVLSLLDALELKNCTKCICGSIYLAAHASRVIQKSSAQVSC
jgi:folylpolyglutamate synthase/dihydrofolate synthase